MILGNAPTRALTRLLHQPEASNHWFCCLLFPTKQTRKSCLYKTVLFFLSGFPHRGIRRISAVCRPGISTAGTRYSLASRQLMTSERRWDVFCAGRKHTRAKGLSANRTQILLDENKVFPSLCPKIEEGETILLQAFARMIREKNKNRSQLQSSSLSSPKCCFTYSSADVADPKLPEVPSLQRGAERGSNTISSAF